MLIRNVTEKDLKLGLDSIDYTFPACPVKEPEQPKEGEEPQPQRVLVVEVGDEKIAKHFIGRTFHCGSNRSGTVNRFDLVEYIRPKDAKPEMKVEIVSKLFPVKATPVPVPVPSIHSFTKRTEPRAADQQPRPSDVVMDDMRKRAISLLPWTMLQKAARKRGLVKASQRIEKHALVDMLFDNGFDPSTATRPDASEPKETEKDPE